MQNIIVEAHKEDYSVAVDDNYNCIIKYTPIGIIKSSSLVYICEEQLQILGIMNIF